MQNAVNDLEQFIFIGKITKTIGLKGAVKVILLTDFPERFLKLKEVQLFDERKNELLINENTKDNSFGIYDVQLYNSFVRISIKGFESIEKATSLLNTLICIDEKKRVKLPKGQYYYYEMIECEVFESEKLLGKVTKIDNFGCSDILFINSTKGSEIMIPLLKEFVTKIDVKNKKIDVKLIEGLIEDDEV
jgi:16S rRNA processing protein RimM